MLYVYCKIPNINPSKIIQVPQISDSNNLQIEEVLEYREDLISNDLEDLEKSGHH